MSGPSEIDAETLNAVRIALEACGTMDTLHPLLEALISARPRGEFYTEVAVARFAAAVQEAGLVFEVRS